MPISISSIVSAAAALAGVLGLVLLAARAARSAGLGGIGRSMRRTAARLVMQDTLALDRTRRMMIVRCDGRDLLLVTGGTADLAVGWLAQSSAPQEGAQR